MWILATTAPPTSVELKTMPQRMNAHVTDPTDVRFLEGRALLHTDWKPDNVLIVNGQTRLVDWACASRGAAWIDPALWVIWLIASGHSAAEAESLAVLHPAWDTTPVSHIDAFAGAQQRLWESIARADQPDATSGSSTRPVRPAGSQYATAPRPPTPHRRFAVRGPTTRRRRPRCTAGRLLHGQPRSRP